MMSPDQWLQHTCLFHYYDIGQALIQVDVVESSLLRKGYLISPTTTLVSWSLLLCCFFLLFLVSGYCISTLSACFCLLQGNIKHTFIETLFFPGFVKYKKFRNLRNYTVRCTDHSLQPPTHINNNSIPIHNFSYFPIIHPTINQLRWDPLAALQKLGENRPILGTTQRERDRLRSNPFFRYYRQNG